MHHVLLSVARQAIMDGFNHCNTLDTTQLYTDYPLLKNNGATFVTLTLNHELRGCIGSLIAYRPLLEDLIHNAKAAAFEDPRFYPLSKDEFKNVNLEISLLSEPEPINYETIADLKTKVIPYADGIIVQKGGRKATFLPQVWEQLPTFELFFSHLCQKAGLGAECLQSHPEVWRYRVEKVR